MHYVYILQSINDPNRIYVGCTNNLKKRLTTHNAGSSPHTAKYMPWELPVYVGFENKASAVAFEKYLKSGSGRVFVDRRLLQKI